MGVVDGVVAAISAPAFMVVGFIFWETHWAGSPFELNVYKCTIASIIFLVAVLLTGIDRLVHATVLAKGMLAFSALIGVVIGDNTWLLALRLIGARRVIVVDCLGPFMGAMLGHFLLGEQIALLGYVGMVITVVGVLLCALETEGDDEEDATGAVPQAPTGTTKRASDLRLGYTLALINVAMDAVGAWLIKVYGGAPLDALDINLMRFGSASAVMLVMYFGSHLRDRLRTKDLPAPKAAYQFVKTGEPGADEVTNPLQKGVELVLPEEVAARLRKEREATASVVYATPDEEEPVPPPGKIVRRKSATQTGVAGAASARCGRFWDSVLEARFWGMRGRGWLLVTLGVLLVTVIYPSLYAYSLFQLHLGVCITLASLGPLYAIPLVYLLRGEKVSWLGTSGAGLAVLGVVMLVRSVSAKDSL